jgi:hypothetical protein
MSRRIRTIALQGVTGSSPPDTYFDRIVKYVPADIVAAWTAATAAVAGAKDLKPTIPADNILWVFFVFLLIITPLWVNKQTHEPGKPRAVKQIIVATAAFVVWVFALGPPFSSLPYYNGLFGTLVIIAFTLVSGLIIPNDQPPPAVNQPPAPVVPPAPVAPNQP